MTASRVNSSVFALGSNNLNLTIGDGSSVPNIGNPSTRVIVGNSGNDQIQITDATNTQVLLGNGNNTVTTGSGQSTVVIGTGVNTIIGGSGHSIVQMTGTNSNFTVTSSQGHAIVTNTATNSVTDISSIQYVQLNSGNALIFANNTEQATIAALYQSAFGRTADSGGLQYWFDLAATGASLSQIAVTFTQSPEFSAEAALNNTQFVQSLYQNIFGRAGDSSGINYWTNALASGTTRAQLISSFASIAANNIDGISHTETQTQIIGSVTIIHNII